MPYYGFSRSVLWQLVPEPVRLSSMGTSSLTYDSSKPPLHTSCILASWIDSWVSRKVLILRAPQSRSDAHFFLLVQMHHTILEQFTLFKHLLLKKVVRPGWPSSCKQKWYMDLSGSSAKPTAPAKPATPAKPAAPAAPATESATKNPQEKAVTSDR